MLAKNKDKVQQLLVRIIPYFSWVHPNTITLFSLFSACLFFLCVITHHFFFALLALLLTTTDALDGAVARYFHKTSSFGALLDATTDRVSDTLIISAFSFAGVIPWGLSLAFILGSFLTSYIRARGELLFKLNMEGVGFMERTERIIGIGIMTAFFLIGGKKIIFLSIPEWVMVVLILLSWYTVFERMIFLKKNS